RRRRQDAAASDQNAAETVRRRHPDRQLDDLAIVEAAVAADHQRLARKTFQRIEDRLEEVFRIVLLLEYRDLLAQARSARLLVGKGRGLYGFDRHGSGSQKKTGIKIGVAIGALFP